MAFRPERPNSSDYAKPFPDWIVDAIPGAAELRDKVAEANQLADAAALEAADAKEKLAAISTVSYNTDGKGELISYAPIYGPKDTVKRTVWDRADDRARAATAKLAPATTAAANARKAYWEHVMDGQESEAFIAQTEPLYAEASRRAQEHLDTLQATLTERDDFAASLGRVIDVEGGNYGVRNALATITAFVTAGLDAVSPRERANELLNEAIGSHMLLPGTVQQLRVEAAEVMDRFPRSPAPAVQDLLRQKGLAR